MNGHLVPVEVGVKGRADQWMELNGFTFNQHGFEGLNSQPMQSRGSVQQYRMLPNYIIQNIPHLRFLPFHHFLGALDSGYISLLLQLVVDKRFKELQGHLLRNPTLMKFQFRSYHNDRPSRVVNPFSQEVLTESPLLSPQHIAQ